MLADRNLFAFYCICKSYVIICYIETTKLVGNRIKMLHDVHTQVETLDNELVELLHTVD